MGNLGWYQAVTTFCKKVGGPRNAFLLTLGVGYAGGKAIELGLKKVKSLLESEDEDEITNNEAVTQFNVSDNSEENELKTEDDLVIVKKAGTDNQGLSFEVGEEIVIRDQDGDSVLIEKVGDQDNPYYVDAAFLNDICSDLNTPEQSLENNEEGSDTTKGKQVEAE